MHLKYFGFVVVKADNGFKFPGGVRRIYTRQYSLIAQEFKKVEKSYQIMYVNVHCDTFFFGAGIGR